jgi:hypothetical protein
MDALNSILPRLPEIVRRLFAQGIGLGGWLRPRHHAMPSHRGLKLAPHLTAGPLFRTAHSFPTESAHALFLRAGITVMRGVT